MPLVAATPPFELKLFWLTVTVTGAPADADSVLIGDYDFGRHPQDITLLESRAIDLVVTDHSPAPPAKSSPWMQ